MKLKKLLKTYKLNESTISLVLGIFVIVVIGILTFNYFKQNKQDVNTTQINKTQNSEAAVPGSVYTVVLGDNLWKIAENAYGSGYNWIDIAEENNLESPYNLEEGQKLNLPKTEVKTATSSDFESIIVDDQKTDEKTVIQDNSYTVQKGDCLWDIAVEKYQDGYKWVEIAQINNLKNPNIIHSGNILTLP